MEQSVLELKAKCEAIEKRESERRAMEERKHAEEIAFLKKTNVQLKVRGDIYRRNNQSNLIDGDRLNWKVFSALRRNKVFDNQKSVRFN